MGKLTSPRLKDRLAIVTYPNNRRYVALPLRRGNIAKPPFAEVILKLRVVLNLYDQIRVN